MRHIDHDSLPHVVEVIRRIAGSRWDTLWARSAARWWGVSLDRGSSFRGLPRFRRHPNSNIMIGAGCKFNSSPVSNLIGVNRPCIISTLREGAQIEIGQKCGFSGTAIGSALKIVLGEDVRCGANTIITDTDWHSEDPRSGPDAPVTIGNNVWLGVNVMVLKGVTIGENTVVAAGSIVTRSLPSDVVAGGVPAKILKQINLQQVRSCHER